MYLEGLDIISYLPHQPIVSNSGPWRAGFAFKNAFRLDPLLKGFLDPYMFYGAWFKLPWVSS